MRPYRMLGAAAEPAVAGGKGGASAVVGKGRASAVVALVVVEVLVLALVALALHPRGQPMAPNNPFQWLSFGLLPPQV